MENSTNSSPLKKFGTAPVFFTAISTILGAILFLRFGLATGNMGFFGVLLIILMGHAITIPTALAISEISTNTRVEGGGEYFIISRSFGLKIGSTIGITLYLAQAVSIAFYIIAFAESFTFFFDWFNKILGFQLPRQVVSLPALLVLAWLVLKKGSGSSMKMLYVIIGILFLSLLCFFLGSPVTQAPPSAEGLTAAPKAVGNNFGFFHSDDFFVWFAICFPAFTGMTAGVGLSGDLKNPSKSIPVGTMLATLTGLFIYVLVIWKFSVSATQAELMGDQLLMSKIALFGAVVIPLGLMASTFSSAMGMAMVAPRTLQALASDHSFPRRINIVLARGKGANGEPFNAAILSFAIAMVFVVIGNVDAVAQVISMFFLITYGALCLISFLNHFGSPPSYRPRFRSRWYFSLGGFLLSVWVMFKIDALYTVLAYGFIVLIYIAMEHSNKEQKGLVNILKGALFQLNRRLQVFMQKNQSKMDSEEWRPATLCISSHSFERDKPIDIMRWLSYQHGFGTYFHFIEGMYDQVHCDEAKTQLATLIDSQKGLNSTLYIDTMISPSYRSALAQVIQAPSISGMENNMVLFEYNKNNADELKPIVDNVPLVKAGNFDVCIFGGSATAVRFRNGIHVWLADAQDTNANLMILLGYIIMAHPEWRKSFIKIFSISPEGARDDTKHELDERIAAGRLPITQANIEIITLSGNATLSQTVVEHSEHAGLVIIGFTEKQLVNDGAFFKDFADIGDTLFVHTGEAKTIG